MPKPGAKMTVDEIVAELRGMESEHNREGMARFGIATEHTLGISVADLRKLARRAGKDHALARQLWDTGLHEARILASIVDVPAEVTEEQMERWVRDFDSWDLCDQCCGNLFWQTEHAARKVFEWSEREPEFEKRAGFALMAYIAWHDKKAPDDFFLSFLPVIRREASDRRNFVRKAVNWALRHIGKRNTALNAEAVALAQSILDSGDRASRWVASDALRELTSETVRGRLG
ncbi:MAG TPA: DNA alkylation repair protein [Chloroflexia bacterium]|nr:DNA alkylation repair protein [Chloroflexia bacterium]